MSSVIDAHHPVLFIDGVIGKLVRDAFRRALQSPNNLLKCSLFINILFKYTLDVPMSRIVSTAAVALRQKLQRRRLSAYICRYFKRGYYFRYRVEYIIPFHRRVSSITH